MERIGDLLLERVPSRGARKPCPLLFVHGMWLGAWCWERYLRAAAEAGWEAWALNLRGHHGSRPVPDLGEVGVEDYVQDVLDCMRVLGEVVLVGHSMGGMITQKVAEVGGVRAAVLMTSAAPRGILVLRWPVLSRMPRYAFALAASRPFLLSREHADVLLLNSFPPDRRAEVFSRMVPESGRAARQLAFGLIAVDEGKVGCPALVVGAERDSITPAAVQRRIAAKYGADYREAAGHGHVLLLEEGWEGPCREVLDWVARALAREGAGGEA